MTSPPNNPQPVVFNINNTHGNNYVNHGVWSQTPETTGEDSGLHLQQPLQMESEKQQTTLKPAEPQQLSDHQLLEQMKERVRRLEQQAQQQEQQQSQIAMGHDTGRYGLHDELVQLQETQQEEQ